MDENLNELNTQDYIYTLAVLPEPGGKLLCLAARQSGLYISEDGCQTWRLAYASLNLEAPQTTTCAAISPSFATDRMLFAGVPGGFLISEDGGQTWLSAQMPSPAPLPSILAVSPNFAADQLLLLGTSEDGVLRSTNQGTSWFAWNFGLLDFNILSLAFSPAFAADETVFAGTSSGLFVSRSGGRSWRESPLPAGPVAVLSLAFSPAFARDGKVYVGTEERGLYASADRGKSWRRLGEGTIDGVVNQILLSPDDPGVLLVAHDNSLLRSDDDGKSWSVVMEGEIACLSAPYGFSPGKLLVGMVDGSVQKI